MRIELGNAAAKTADGSLFGEDCVTYYSVPDEEYPLGVFDEAAWQRGEIVVTPVDVAALDVNDVSRHIMRSLTTGVTRLPGLEALLPVLHPTQGFWATHSQADPAWVHVEGRPDVEQFISDYFGGIPIGRPADVEDTHWTDSGMPGVGPDPLAGFTALKTNAGNDIQNNQMFRGGGVTGQTGTATATSATSLTGSAEAPGGSHGVNDAAGMVLVAWTTGVFALVLSNTSGTTPVYTVDRWSTPGTPGGAAATTPSATTGYSLLPASAVAWFVGLTANSGAPASGDTTLTGEITTAGGGLIRKIAPTAHTAGTNVTTLTPVFTANGTDSLPVTVAKIGVSNSMVSTVNQLFQTLLNATATLTASGDQLTVTETVTT